MKGIRNDPIVVKLEGMHDITDVKISLLFSLRVILVKFAMSSWVYDVLLELCCCDYK